MFTPRKVPHHQSIFYRFEKEPNNTCPSRGARGAAHRRGVLLHYFCETTRVRAPSLIFTSTQPTSPQHTLYRSDKKLPLEKADALGYRYSAHLSGRASDAAQRRGVIEHEAVEPHKDRAHAPHGVPRLRVEVGHAQAEPSGAGEPAVRGHHHHGRRFHRVLRRCGERDKGGGGERGREWKREGRQGRGGGGETGR